MNQDNIEPNEVSNEALFFNFIDEERNNDTEERFSSYIRNIHSDKNEDNKTRESTNNRKNEDN